MTTTAPVQNGLHAVHDYYMPGRAEMEPGTNALVHGAKMKSAGAPGQQPEAVEKSGFLVRMALILVICWMS